MLYEVVLHCEDLCESLRTEGLRKMMKSAIKASLLAEEKMLVNF